MKVLTNIRVIIALCIFSSCSSETEKSTKLKEKITSIVQASSDTVSNLIDGSNTSKVSMISEITQDELDRHNNWLLDNIKWDTAYLETWIGDKKVKQNYEHDILTYEDSIIKIYGNSINGMDEEISLGILNDVSSIYCSKKSVSGKYLTAIFAINYDYVMYHIDIEKKHFTHMGGRGPYLWVSWSPDDSYSVSMARYEGDTELFCFNNTEKSSNEFNIYQSISDDKYIVFDERTLQWISNNEFIIDVYLFCYTYGEVNTSEDCDQWNSEDWYGLKELGEKHTYRFSCESGSIKVLN